MSRYTFDRSFPAFRRFPAEAAAVCPAKHTSEIKVTQQMPAHRTINLWCSDPIARAVIPPLISN